MSDLLMNFGKREMSNGRLSRIPRLQFNNGSSLSVQASEYHYCSPKDNTGPYSAVEVGFPEGTIPSWWDDTDTVMGWVTAEQITSHIEGCGGLKPEQQTLLLFSSVKEVSHDTE
jgi:hypothetical protein